MSFNQQKKTTVASPNLEWQRMSEHWSLVDALDSGTLGMRAAGKTYLPQEDKENQHNYANRLARSTLFGAYTRSLDVLAGLPFTRPVVLEALPPELEYLSEDADSTGSDITAFAYNLLREALHRGVASFLVEMPSFDTQPSIEEARINKVRPYFCPISAKNLIAWTTEKFGGVEVLTEIRIAETTTLKDGWGEKEVNRIRVVRPNEILLFEADDKGDYSDEPTEVRVNGLGRIPLLTVYAKKDGLLTATPSLEDLAFLNLKHWQQMSDFENLIHIVNLPILWAKGVPEGSLDGSQIGPNRLLSAESDKASLEFVEHSGAAIGSTMKAIEALENRIAAMGGDLTIRRSVDRQTATARMADKSESLSILQIVINEIEAALEQAIKISAEWLNLEEPSPIANISDQLTLPSGANTVDILLQHVIDNEGMSVNSSITELKRRGIFSDVFPLVEDGDEPSDNSKEPTPNSETPEDNNEDEVINKDENDNP